MRRRKLSLQGEVQAREMKIMSGRRINAKKLMLNLQRRAGGKRSLLSGTTMTAAPMFASDLQAQAGINLLLFPLQTQVPPIRWVCCDACSGWFHVPCLFLPEEQMALLDTEKEYYCPHCVQDKIKVIRIQ